MLDLGWICYYDLVLNGLVILTGLFFGSVVNGVEYIRLLNEATNHHLEQLNVCTNEVYLPCQTSGRDFIKYFSFGRPKKLIASCWRYFPTGLIESMLNIMLERNVNLPSLLKTTRIISLVYYFMWPQLENFSWI